MKVILLYIIAVISSLKLTLKETIKNPDENLDSNNGGNNGEFNRRTQPQEHIVIPLINTLEAEYTPNINIQDYTKSIVNEQDKQIKRTKKLSEFMRMFKS